MTHIIATVGKACQRGSFLLEMARSGMTIARINFSHENTATHSERVKLIKKLNGLGAGLKLFLDLQGPEVRLWNMEKPLPLKNGGEVVLSGSPENGIQVSNPVF